MASVFCKAISSQPECYAPLPRSSSEIGKVERENYARKPPRLCLHQWKTYTLVLSLIANALVASLFVRALQGCAKQSETHSSLFLIYYKFSLIL